MAIFNKKFIITPTDGGEVPLKVLMFKWFKKHKPLIGLLFVFALFATLLLFIVRSEFQLLTHNTNGTEIKAKGKWPYMVEKSLPIEPCVTMNQCVTSQSCIKIVCLRTSIDVAIEFANNYEKVELELQYVTFPNNVIDKETFTNLKSKITYLSLMRCQIIDIGECPFAFEPFAYLDYLVLSEVDFDYLERRMLCGTNLLQFEFKFDTLRRNVRFERGLLDDSTNLQALQIQHCLSDSQSIVNITGSDGYLNALVRLDFRYNSVKTLEANSFLAAPNVLQIFLDNGGLERIDLHAFANTYRLTELTLHNNRLSHLIENVFANVQFKSLTIHNNPWSCDCQLKWLQTYYAKDFVAKECTLCYNLQTPIDKAQFCDDPSTDVTIPTTIITAQPTVDEATTEEVTSKQTIEAKYKTVECKNLYYTEKRASIGKRIQTIRIHEDGLTLEFYEYDDEPSYTIKLTIDHDGDFDISKFKLMWFNYDDYRTNCYTNLENVMYLHDLERSTTYTVCLMQKQHDSIGTNDIYTPRHCRGLTTTDPWQDQPFIKNGAMQYTIIIVACALIGTILLTAFITYVCIRKYPNLIKGSKKIIVIKEKDPSLMYKHCNEFDRPVYTDPSRITYDQGYLTPNLQKCSRIRYKPPLQCGVNRPGSCTYQDQVYIEADEPTRLQLETWRMNVRKRPRLETIYGNSSRTEDNIEYDEIPPPVPSGHPCDRRRKSLHSVYNHKLYGIA